MDFHSACGLLLGLTVIAGLLAGFVLMADLKIADAEGVVPLLDAARSDSLAGWFSSLLIWAGRCGQFAGLFHSPAQSSTIIVVAIGSGYGLPRRGW